MVVDVGPILGLFFQSEIRAINSRVSGVPEWWYGSEQRHHEIIVAAE